jgi:hypothetical protein
LGFGRNGGRSRARCNRHRSTCARVSHDAERVIDQQHMGAAPHHGAADTGPEIAAAFAGRPSAFGLAVLSKPRIENLTIFLRRNQIADVAAKVFRQGRTRRGGDELL